MLYSSSMDKQDYAWLVVVVLILSVQSWRYERKLDDLEQTIDFVEGQSIEGNEELYSRVIELEDNDAEQDNAILYQEGKLSRHEDAIKALAGGLEDIWNR